MKIGSRVWLALILLPAGATLNAQSSPQQPAVRIPDGGGSGRIDSIFIPPKPGAPFSLVLDTEWTRPMSGGGSFTLANERRILRDSRGRIYQERWILVPKGGDIKSTMDIFQITDPGQHTWYNCHTATRVCDLFLYSLTTTERYGAAIGSSGPLPNGAGYRQVDDLGVDTIAGMGAHGYRETMTINSGVMGNDRQMVGRREFWYSEQLGISLKSILDTPETGRQVFTAKEVSMSEPEPSYFAIPEGFKVVDQRGASQ